MLAKEAFEKIGYEQIIYNSIEPVSNGIQYIKKDDATEMERVGRIKTKYIEFNYTHKEIVIYHTYQWRNGNVSKSDFGILNLDEFNAVQQQINELEWQK